MSSHKRSLSSADAPAPKKTAVDDKTSHGNGADVAGQKSSIKSLFTLINEVEQESGSMTSAEVIGIYETVEDANNELRARAKEELKELDGDDYKWELDIGKNGALWMKGTYLGGYDEGQVFTLRIEVAPFRAAGSVPFPGKLDKEDDLEKGQ